MKIGKKSYFVDLRLNQLRNVKDPGDFIDIGPEFWFIAAIKFRKKKEN